MYTLAPNFSNCPARYSPHSLCACVLGTRGPKSAVSYTHLVEDKGYIERNLGDCDKRQMYFSLTAEGKKILKEMECCNIEIPELLRSVL